MTRIRRTDDEAREFPDVPLIAGMSPGGFESYITGQEAQGQRELVRSQQLPRMGLNHPRVAELGIVVHEGGNDPVFADVTLPDGFRKQPTDHSMWSHLLDGEGRLVASIFYKAAFYDRNAHIQWEQCLRIEDWTDSDGHSFDSPHLTGDSACVACVEPPVACTCGKGLMHSRPGWGDSLNLRCDFCRKTDYRKPTS